MVVRTASASSGRLTCTLQWGLGRFSYAVGEVDLLVEEGGPDVRTLHMSAMFGSNPMNDEVQSFRCKWSGSASGPAEIEAWELTGHKVDEVERWPSAP